MAKKGGDRYVGSIEYVLCTPVSNDILDSSSIRRARVPI